MATSVCHAGPFGKLVRRLFATVCLGVTLLATSGCGGAPDIDDAPVPTPASVPFALHWQQRQNDLHDCYLVDNQHGWAVGQRGTILATRDGGQTWEPQDSGVTSTLTSVFFVSPTHGWIAGDEGTMLRTTNGGQHWEPQTLDTGIRLHSVRFSPDGLVGWVLAGREILAGLLHSPHGIYATEDGGRTWFNLPGVPLQPGASTGLPQLFAGGFLLDREHAWLATTASEPTGDIVNMTLVDSSTKGVSYRVLRYRRTDRKATWTASTTGIEIPRLGLWTSGSSFSLLFLNERVGWAIGGGNITATSDGGMTWKLQVRSHTAFVPRLFFADTRHGWATGFRLGKERLPALMRTEDGGTHWELVGMDPPIDLEGVSFAAGGKVGVGVGKGGLIARTTDGGLSWHAPLPRTLPSNQDLNEVAFVDARNGWIVGDYGTILSTRNGGTTWQHHRSGTSMSLLGAHILDPDTVWVVGPYGTVLHTWNAGATWESKAPEPAAHFTAVAFSDRANGWIVGGLPLSIPNGATNKTKAIVLRTRNSGSTWESQQIELDDTLSDIFVAVDGRHAWCVGPEGAVFATSDGGETWIRQATHTSADFTDVYFLNDKQGWVVGGGSLGSDAVALRTQDGGATWVRQTAGTDEQPELRQISFADEHTGWLLSSRGIFATLDGGVTWSPRDVLPPGPNAGGAGIRELSTQVHSIAVLPDKRAWIVGEDGLVIEGSPGGSAPYVSHFLASDSVGGTELRWRTAHADPATVECSMVEFRRDQAAPWTPIDVKPMKEGRTDRCRLTWQPAERPHQIAPGTTLYYRVTLKDKDHLTFGHALPDGYPFRSWWDRRTPVEKGVLIAVAVFILYAAIGVLLLGVYPLALVWLIRHAQGMSSWMKSLPEPVLTLIDIAALLPFFARRARTRRAWLQRFQDGRARLEELPKTLQESYLTTEDGSTAWVHRYGQGLESFDRLLPDTRERFLNEPRCLDAWVARRRDRAIEAFSALRRSRGLTVYIPLPIRDDAAGTLLETPTAAQLRGHMTKGERAIIVVGGPGGSGKSTLAFEIARWALADDPAERLAPHPMLPVFVDGEFSDLKAHLLVSLRQVAGDFETDDALVLSLLRHKRLLVIVDALSERTPGVQRQVAQAFGAGVPLNALLLTSRRTPDFGPVSYTVLRPEPIDADKLVYFLVAYLRQTGADQLFPHKEPLRLGARLIDITETGAKRLVITPLLIRLLVDEARSIAEDGKSLDLDRLSDSVPRLMVEYVRRTNPQHPATPNYVRNDHLIRAARLLGEVSLGPSYVPGDFYRTDAHAALAKDGLPADLDPDVLIERLIDNGPLESREVGGTVFLRFLLDPLAEYLAALAWLDRLRADRQRWEEWLNALQQKSTYPLGLRGFLVAFEDCVRAYAGDFEVPDDIEAQLLSLTGETSQNASAQADDVSA